MIIDWDIYAIRSDIDKIARAESDPRIDGFNCWECKKELYELYWYIEDKLEKCSTYTKSEEALLEERREQKIIRKIEKSHENNRD